MTNNKAPKPARDMTLSPCIHLGAEVAAQLDRLSVLLAAEYDTTRPLNRSQVARMAIRYLLLGLLAQRADPGNLKCPYSADFLAALNQAQRAGEYPRPHTFPYRETADSLNSKKRQNKLRRKSP